MATVAAAIATLPVIYQSRYSTQFIAWFNELLEELSVEGLLPSMRIEGGFVVDNDVWITKPSGLQEVLKICNPQAIDQEYNWEDINGKIKLKDVIVNGETTPAAITAFTNYNVAYVDVDIAGKSVDDFKDYLLVLSTGTWANRTYQISGNDASGATTTRIYFLHDLPTAMSDLTAITGYLTHPDYYVMMKYLTAFTAIAAASEANPIDAVYQMRITKAWLEWKCAAAIQPSGDTALAARGEYSRVLDSIQAKERKMNGPMLPRYSPGFLQYQNRNSDMNVTFERDS
jgi:hypothetical protein